MKTFKSRHISVVFAVLTLISLCLPLSLPAASMTWNINASGAQEIGGGDTDGSAIGFLTLSNGVGGFTGTAVLNLTLANIAFPLGGWHVHSNVFGANGSIFLDFGSAEAARSGNTLSATVTGLSTATINNVFADSTRFYFNLHNTPFPGGAVRDQLTSVVPEPTSLALAAVGVIGFALRRKVKTSAR